MRSDVIDRVKAAHRDALAGRLPEFPAIEWYIHTPVDPSLQDADGHHSSALFVQWVPFAPVDGPGGVWSEELTASYSDHLSSICDRFAPGTSDLVVDTFALHPQAIRDYFGIQPYGHIHHIDNVFGFADRHPYRTELDGLYCCSAACHPAGSVIGAAGHNAAMQVLEDMGQQEHHP